MAYAQLADVKARAGVLAKAWGSDTEVGDDDIDRLITQVADELDAFIGAAGVATPVTDDKASKALVGVNADKALLLAIDATWPGGSGDVAALRQQVADRVTAYDTAITEGKLPSLLYLSDLGSAGLGASSFWDDDAETYLYWSSVADRLSGWGGLQWLDPWGVPVQAGPQFSKGMRF